MSQNDNITSRRGFLAGGAKLTAGVLAAGILNTDPATSNAQTAGYEKTASENIDMVTWYEVDANWPQKPADITWGTKEQIGEAHYMKFDRISIHRGLSLVISTEGRNLFPYVSPSLPLCHSRPHLSFLRKQESIFSYFSNPNFLYRTGNSCPY